VQPGKPGTLRKPAAPKASEAKGNLSGDRRHSRRDEEDGANHRTSDAGSAERERGRGNPEPKPRLSGKIKGMRPTRNLIGRLERSIDDPLRYRLLTRRRQRPQGFWRFRFWGVNCEGQKQVLSLNNLYRVAVDKPSEVSG